MRIQQLSPHVANQIAAGEVIERPASVVKELLENALDAGATVITIDIGFGGLNLIKIADNGHGIDAEDLPLAIAAHATSKIKQLTDLYAISSMGFRGEALASIAAVSRLKLYSKPAAQAHGMLLQVDETGIHTEPCARTQGTTIEVCDLFFNTPVRKTFLKSERHEYQAIELVVKQFALAAPNIALTLQHNQKLTLHLSKTNCEASRLRRIKKIFGQAFLSDAIFIQEAHADFTMYGWISQREYQRSQRDRQWVYLNKRLIKDKLMLQAIGQAYQDILHPGRYPSCILYISIPPDQVDVNVHPTKHEVRFRQPRLVHAMLVSGLANRLHTEASTANHFHTVHPPQKISHYPPPSPAQSTEQGIAWQILNSHFAILGLQDAAPYLVDIAKVNHHYIANMLQTLPKPFPHRALLVPVRIDIATSAYSYIEQQREDLRNLGIQFDFVSTNQILIRTMPLHLPLLDLQRFFMVVQTPDLKEGCTFSPTEKITGRGNEGIKSTQQLIACQTFDAYNISPIERDTLLDYCLQNWDTMHKVEACLPLDVTTCQHMMRQIRTCPSTV